MPHTQRHLSRLDKRVQRCDVDDASLPPGSQRSKKIWQAAKRRGRIHIQDRVPFAVGHLDRRFLQDGAGGVDEDVHLSEFGKDAIAQPFDRASFEYVGR